MNRIINNPMTTAIATNGRGNTAIVGGADTDHLLYIR